MAVIGTAVAQFKADTSGYSAGVRKAREENKGFFEEIRSFAGRGSVLHDVLGVALGTGIAAGLGEGSRVIKELTENVLKLHDEFESTGGSAAEIADKVASSLPIVGNLYDSLKDVAEAITGIRDETQDTADVMKDLDFNKSFMDHVKEVKDMATRQIAAAGRKGDEALQLAYAPPGLDRDLLKAKFNYEDHLQEVSDNNDKKMGEDKSIAGARDRLKTLQGEASKAAQNAAEAQKNIQEMEREGPDPGSPDIDRMAMYKNQRDEALALEAEKKQMASAAQKEIADLQNAYSQKESAQQIQYYKEYIAEVKTLKDEEARKEIEKSAEVHRQEFEQAKDTARKKQQLNAETARRYAEVLNEGKRIAEENIKEFLSGKWLKDFMPKTEHGYSEAHSSMEAPRFAEANIRRFSSEEALQHTDEAQKTTAKTVVDMHFTLTRMERLILNIFAGGGNAAPGIADIF